MTDLHTHILPGMDDGAKDLEAAVALLEQEYLQGVRRVALTSHYHCLSEPLEQFLDRRERAFGQLRAAVPEQMQLKRGCEVFYDPELLNIDVERLCLEGTNILLLELPILQKPAFFPEFLTALTDRGIVPLIAHAERYTYVVRDPALLARWISLGALIQVNALSVIGPEGRFARRLLKWGLVHVLTSDAHSILYRPPNLRPAMHAVSRSLGPDRAQELQRNAALIFSGQPVPTARIHTPKKVLGLWV